MTAFSATDLSLISAGQHLRWDDAMPADRMARLEQCMMSCRDSNHCQAWNCGDMAVLFVRVRELETGLEEYADHRDDCAKQKTMNKAEWEAARHNPLWRPPTCTCGLAALAGVSEVLS